MGQEIERKFLVNKIKWNAITKPEGALIRQGYLLTDPNKTIRIRQSGCSAYLTIKGLSVGTSRPEFEYEIPLADALELLDRFSVSTLTKIRYTLEINGNIWEIDEFLEENTGLLIAEIELTDEKEEFIIPDWTEVEVTAEAKYYNSNLSVHPYSKW